MEVPKEAYLFRVIVKIDGKVTYRFSVVGDDKMSALAKIRNFVHYNRGPGVAERAEIDIANKKQNGWAMRVMV